jgi:hypothetical protein
MISALTSVRAVRYDPTSDSGWLGQTPPPTSTGDNGWLGQTPPPSRAAVDAPISTAPTYANPQLAPEPWKHDAPLFPDDPTLFG